MAKKISSIEQLRKVAKQKIDNSKMDEILTLPRSANKSLKSLPALKPLPKLR